MHISRAFAVLALASSPLAACGDAPSAGMAAGMARADAVKVAYSVEGMHCDGCAGAIVAEVQEVKGVRSVECTFASGQAVITLDDPSARPEAERAITKLGYRIAPAPAAAAAQLPDSR